MICLANSFPIDPPAPIIQTDLPFIPGPNKEFMYKLKGERKFKKYTTNYKEEK